MKKYQFVLSIIIVAALACGKKLESNSYYDCSKKLSLDSGATANKLIGLWKWTRRECMDNNASSPADKNVRIEFKTDSTFKVIQDTSTITTGTWALSLAESQVFQLQLSEQSVYLYGRILFCEDEVLFNDSFRDGCDHLFIKQ